MEKAKELSRAGAKKGAAAELKFQAAETAELQGRCARGRACEAEQSTL